VRRFAQLHLAPPLAAAKKQQDNARVLIDGLRVAPYPLGTDNGAVTFVDLNSIPKAALDSIEILKDGASSIYGADAVAGVVNFKLRHDYRGAEVNVQYGNTLDKDSGEFASSLIFGVGDNHTDITGVMNYYHRNSIFNHDRGYSNTVRFTFSNNASPLNLQLSRDAVLATGVSPTALPDDLDTFFGHAPFPTNGNAPASDYIYTRRPSVFFNFNRYSEALPDSERYGGFVNFDHKICGDQLLVYGDFFYQNVKTSYDLAPTATGPFQTPGDVTLAIPPDTPIAPMISPAAFLITTPPGNVINPPFECSILNNGPSGFTNGVNADVSIWNHTAVLAFFMAISIDPNHALSIFTNATRFAPLSTIAIFIFVLIFSAFVLAASIITSACFKRMFILFSFGERIVSQL